MNGIDEESLSALMDGELSGPGEAQAVDGLMSRDDLRQRWATYHMVRAVLRGEIDRELGAVVAERVRLCLADEPAHEAPRYPTRRVPRALLAPAAGVALAASVATVAIIGIRGWNAEAPRQPVASEAAAPAARTPGTSIAAAPSVAARTGEARLADLDGRERAIARPALDNRLDNRYVFRHSEYGGSGLRGMHPYARIIGHEAAAGAR